MSDAATRAVNKTILARNFRDPVPAASLGYRYHHIGIPTRNRRPGEHYLSGLKVWASSFETSVYGIEWLRFEADSPLPLLVQTVPHVAFEVDDLDAALKDKAILLAPFVPFEGVRSAMIEENGAPVELIEFTRR